MLDRNGSRWKFSPRRRPRGRNQECLPPLLLPIRRPGVAVAGGQDVRLVHDGDATLGSFAVVALAVPISDWLFGGPARANLLRAGAVGLWAQMNYTQVASLLRV
jgi:hypothetical protein